MADLNNQCVRCGAITTAGQFYRFHFWIVVFEAERTPDGKVIDPGPLFQARGSEEIFYCDRCLLQAAARAERRRAGFFLFLGLFGMVVAILVGLASTGGFWVSVVLSVFLSVRAGAAYRECRRLHRALHADDPDRARQAVRSKPWLQNMGDEWAIAHRRPELQGEGTELFLTRQEYEMWERPGGNGP